MSLTASDPWLGVEPRHLATFSAVAETGSFRAAAARFGYVQSAVSQQIAHLERVLQTRLIERGKGSQPLALTPAGLALRQHANRVVQQVRAARADVACLTGESTLRIAVEPAAAPLLPSVVLRLAAAHSAMQMTVLDAPSDQQAALVVSGDVDLAVGTPACLDPALDHEVLKVDPWLLVFPADAEELCGGSIDPLEALRGARLIEDRSQPMPIDPAELGVAAVMPCDRASLALELVRGGAGYAILCAASIGEPDPSLGVIELGGLIPPRVFSLIWSRCRRLPVITGAQGAFAEDAHVRPLVVAA